MRNGKRHRLCDRRVVQDHFIHLPGGDLLPAPIDELLQASSDGEVAVSIQVTQVARLEPAIDESGPVRLRVVLIRLDDVGTAKDDLARSVRG